ncbi:MAG: transposase InsO family protein [Planctomycetota bacterium]
MILFGAGHLRRTLNEFAAHYHSDRPHQGIGNNRITPTNDEPPICELGANQRSLIGHRRA